MSLGRPPARGTSHGEIILKFEIRCLIHAAVMRIFASAVEVAHMQQYF
jgi:hypothetical protein